MQHLGDYELGSTIDFQFTTTAADTGAPTTLSGTPAISAYVGNSVTQLTAGITLTADFDSVTGLNHVRVVLTSGNGYADNTDVMFVITTGTVGGTSVVGYVVGRCSIGRHSAYRRLGSPAGASVSADIATVDGNVDSILVDTAEIGAAGAGLTEAGGTGDHLTAVPWNAAWDAEVQSEVADGLTAYNAVSTTDLPTNFGDLSITATTGLVDFTQTAADKVWGTTTRVLTANTNLNDPTAAAIRSEIDSNSTQLAAIVADTNELQGDWANGGRLDLILDARASQTSVDGLNDLSSAEVNAEVVDALATDTYAEPGQGTPSATLSLAAKINYLFKAWRNRSTQTATTYSLYNDDATTVDQKATVSEDGTTADKGEVTTGP